MHVSQQTTLSACSFEFNI